MSKTIAKQEKTQNVRAQYRVNGERKKKAEAILKAQGIKPSQAIDMFLAQVVRDRGFPFKCSGIPNAETAKALEESAKGIGVQSFNSTEEMLESFDAL